MSNSSCVKYIWPAIVWSFIVLVAPFGSANAKTLYFHYNPLSEKPLPFSIKYAEEKERDRVVNEKFANTYFWRTGYAYKDDPEVLSEVVSSVNSIVIVNTSISNSNSSSEFFNNIGSADLTSSEKLAFRLQIGAMLGYLYDEGMRDAGVREQMSAEEMFNALKHGSLAGICGNIHNFTSLVDEALGFESWNFVGTTYDSGHVAEMLVYDEQIIIGDYGTGLNTETLDYGDASGIAERLFGNVFLFEGYVSEDGVVLFPVRSKAQKLIEDDLAGYKDKLIENMLLYGPVSTVRDGISANIGPESKIVTLASTSRIGTFSVSSIRWSDVAPDLKLESQGNNSSFYTDLYDHVEDPYNSISELAGTKLSFFKGLKFLSSERLKNELVFDLNILSLDFDMKDLEGSRNKDNLDNNAALSRIAFSYVGSYTLNSNKLRLGYGFLYQVGAVKAYEDSFSGINDGGNRQVEESVGVSVSFPVGSAELSIVSSSDYRTQYDNFEDQNQIWKNSDDNYAVLLSGLSVKYLGKADLKLSFQDADWGDTWEFAAGFQKRLQNLSFSYKKSNSDYERFMPDSKEFGLSFSRNVKSSKMFIELGYSSEQYKGDDKVSQNLVMFGFDTGF